jgi:Protein of unknown function (DUF2505)
VDFTIEHRFAADPQAVATVLLDESYQNSLDGIGPLSERTLLEQKVLDDGRVQRRIRCVLGTELPGAARRLLGDSDPAWIENAMWFPDEMRWEWTIEPEAAADLLESAGAIDLAGGKSRTLRTVSGRVKVKVPVFGGRVEGWIVDGLKRAYDEEANVLRTHLG